MGCDIHLTVEQRGDDGVWRRVLPSQGLGCKWCQETRLIDKDGELGAYDKMRERECWECGRQYPAFAVLANVRNGYGFGGIETGEAITPVAEPRGLPEDVSAEVRALYDDESYNDADPKFWLGDHSWSWVTLRELEDYNADAGQNRCGVIAWEDWLEWDGGRPKEWSGAIVGPGIVTLSVSEAVAMLESGGPPEGIRPYVNVWWEEPVRESASLLFDPEKGLVARLQKAKLGTSDNVRLVFGFDS